jgi:putative transposase
MRSTEVLVRVVQYLDLYSRMVVGWTMKSIMTTELVLDALMMACWRRCPKNSVIIHSDQGSQFGSDDHHISFEIRCPYFAPALLPMFAQPHQNR